VVSSTFEKRTSTLTAASATDREQMSNRQH
jgi:hypothetical protein